MSDAPNMIDVTIDDVQVSVPQGTLVIRAAEQAGIRIPRFCDHPLLAPVAAGSIMGFGLNSYRLGVEALLLGKR